VKELIVMALLILNVEPKLVESSL